MSRTLRELQGVRVLVIGDCMLDRYVQGIVTRISPEGPVPVVSFVEEYNCLGGAGNVAAGIAARLGGSVVLGGVVGNDPEGEEFLRLCNVARVATDAVTRISLSPTISKTRIIADRRQPLLRLDRDGLPQLRSDEAKKPLAATVEMLKDFDVLVLSDYNKGTLSSELIRDLVKGSRLRGIPCVIDPKRPDFSSYRGATILTPNVAELLRAAPQTSADEGSLTKTCRRTCIDLDLDFLLCTRGPEGMILCSPSTEMTIPAIVRNVADVTGAGDTVVAALALCLGRGWPVDDACRLATVSAGIAVTQPNTYVVSFGELDQACNGTSHKILDAAGALQRVRVCRQAGQRIVFTNGCFDVLHAGHLACLEGAKSYGDVLVLGLNSDESVRRNKGEGRPRIGELHRAALLAGLECIDLVVIFDDDTPEELLRLLRPDVLVKGGDYLPEEVVGADIVQAYGGLVATIPAVQGLSTTAILSDHCYVTEPSVLRTNSETAKRDT